MGGAAGSRLFLQGCAQFSHSGLHRVQPVFHMPQPEIHNNAIPLLGFQPAQAIFSAAPGASDKDQTKGGQKYGAEGAGHGTPAVAV
jgi:hypothetical protein